MGDFRLVTLPKSAAFAIASVLFGLAACSPSSRSGSEESPIPISDDEASKVSGKVDPTEKGVLKIDVDKGSSWNVSWLEVEVRRESDKVKRQFRAYAMVPVYETRTIRSGQMELPQQVLKEMRKTAAPPLGNLTFYASVSDFLADVKSKADYEVSILSVVGYKKK